MRHILLCIFGAVLFLTMGCNTFSGVNDWNFPGDTNTDSDTGTENVSNGDSSNDTNNTNDTDSDNIPNACAGVNCSSPPPNVCENETELKIFDYRGWCVNGECVYGDKLETCKDGTCQGNRCTANPCQGMRCTTPPANECNGSNLAMYSNTGRCVVDSGIASCQYSKTDVSCDGNCSTGQCSDDACVGVICDMPPARYCNGSTVIDFETGGRCVNGVCEYLPIAKACNGVCEAGVCQDAEVCAQAICNRPPANYCSSENLLVSFHPQGTCDNGRCFYAPVEVLCAEHCDKGQCVEDPCAGVTCLTPPASYCKSETDLTCWNASSGECKEGVCIFEMETSACEEGGCVEGLCENDYCERVVCGLPPGDYCSENVLMTYFAGGGCSDGICTYTSTGSPCDSGCIEGRCSADLGTD